MDTIYIPSPEQLALALTIVKYKPVVLDLKDYISQIRAFIKPQEGSDRSCSQEKFFDSVAFWRQAYEKSEAEQIKLLDRIYELEKRNEDLQFKLQLHNNGSLDTGQDQAKRKAPSKGSSRSLTSRKRVKTQAAKSPSAPQQLSPIDTLGSLDSLNCEAMATFMRHFYILQKVLQKRPNTQSITQAAVSLSNISVNELLGVLRDYQPVVGRPPKQTLAKVNLSHPQRVLRSVECAVLLLFQALKKLSHNGIATKEAGLVIYHIVRLYDTAMNILTQYCKTKSERPIVSKNTKGKAKSKSKSKNGSKQEASSDIPGVPLLAMDEGANQVAGLLSQMISLLDLSNEEHQQALEGFLFILLNRIGKLLCIFVFQDLQLRPDLQINPTKLSLPEGLVGTELDASSLCAAQMEATHLIRPLENALLVLEDSTPMPDNRIRHADFVSRMKRRLQSTLLQAVFGSNTNLGDRLKRPPEPSDQDFQRLCQLPDLSASDWFIQEVWRLLGWEMLVECSPFQAE